MRWVTIWVLVMGVAGCGSNDGAATDAATFDSGRDAATQTDALAPDASSVVDAGSGTDASEGEDDAAPSSDASADAASGVDASPVVDAEPARDAAACTGVEGPMPRGICDGRGMVGCRIWAEESSGRPENAYAICIQAGIGGCARADRCVDATDPSTCTCGGAEPCKEHEVCVSDMSSGPRYCTCATRMP